MRGNHPLSLGAHIPRMITGRRGMVVALAGFVLMAVLGWGIDGSGPPQPLEVAPLPAEDVAVPPPPAPERTRPATASEPGAPAMVSLDASFERAGYQLPPGADVFAVRILPGTDGPATYATYEAGDGAHDTTLWPASSVKVLAAVGALAYLKTLGFTGAATVSTDLWSATVSDLYDEAVRHSSNDAYDNLVEIAGVDWLNEVFLTEANGFADTVIQRSYAYGNVVTSPEMTVTEAGRTVTIAARVPEVELGVPDGGNRSTVAEMVDSVRRVTLDADLPGTDRLGLASEDLEQLIDALLGAEGFIERGVVDVLGDDALVYNKPGWVMDEACIDVALVVDPDREERFLLGIATPDDGTECEALATIASVVLASLKDD